MRFMKHFLIRLNIIFMLFLLLLGCTNEEFKIEEKEKIYFDTRLAFSKAFELFSLEWRKDNEERDINHIINVLSEYYAGETLENINQFLYSFPKKANEVDPYTKLNQQYINKIPIGTLLADIDNVELHKKDSKTVFLKIHTKISDLSKQDYVLMNGEKVYQITYQIELIEQNEKWKITKYFAQMN